MSKSDATARFSDRVEAYVRSRPGYPTAVTDELAATTGLSAGSAVADVGSGTGISTELFLRAGCTVFAVEPNAEMRAAAERLLGGRAGFHSVDGTAEATTLADRAVDYVVAGQAFHWFDVPRTRREFARILKPEGWCVLLWNTRAVDRSEFGRSYEALVREFGTDYGTVRHENIDPAQLRDFFDAGTYQSRAFPNEQRLDRADWLARLESSSYLPGPGHARHAAMSKSGDALFDAHQRGGRITIEYDTEIHFGRVTGAGGR